MKILRAGILVLFVVGVAFDTPAAYVDRTTRCAEDVDSGARACSALCKYPNTCVYDGKLPTGTYCWKALLTNGTWSSCHQGNYDPCCDPNYQW